MRTDGMSAACSAPICRLPLSRRPCRMRHACTPEPGACFLRGCMHCTAAVPSHYEASSVIYLLPVQAPSRHPGSLVPEAATGLHPNPESPAGGGPAWHMLQHTPHL